MGKAANGFDGMVTVMGSYSEDTAAAAYRRRPSGTVRGGWIDSLAPVPWQAAVGGKAVCRAGSSREPLYTPEERRRRDATGWTLVQGILAPVQFLVFLVSLALVLQFLATGHGYEAAVLSVIIKTGVLLAIMITGSVWEKVVFGKWLFARPFFWEDVVSMGVIALHLLYVAALLNGWGNSHDQMIIALAAYTAYVINAVQFILKLRAARLEDPRQQDGRSHGNYAARGTR
jgi:3-vinyl bacteriochlorophyllide hydratase